MLSMVFICSGDGCLTNWQVTHSLNTASIDGAMGLSRSVAVIAKEFNY
jgi:hypothetical protein